MATAQSIFPNVYERIESWRCASAVCLLSFTPAMKSWTGPQKVRTFTPSQGYSLEVADFTSALSHSLPKPI